MSWRQIVNTFANAAQIAGRAVDAAIMPRCCVFCGSECEMHEPFCCDGCAADLPWIAAQCACCAAPFADGSADGRRCGACQRTPPPYVSACAPLSYSFPVDAAIKALKFRRRLDYVPAFGAILVAALQTMPGDIDSLLPVPLHRWRHVQRGFNQAMELCKPLGNASGLPVITSIVRIRPTPFQSGLTAVERQGNLRAAFAARGHIDARHVLLVDDVITTGATCRQLAEEALRAGAGKVSVLALAHSALTVD